jgi:hypothetical protein
MKLASLNFQGIYDKSGTVPASPANQGTTKRKIALAEGLVDAFDGTVADLNRNDDAITLFDEKTNDVVQVNTQKDGSRRYRFDHNSLDKGLLWGERRVTREVIEVSPAGEVQVSVSYGKSTTGGLLTGPLIDERLPTFHREQNFLFADPYLQS